MTGTGKSILLLCLIGASGCFQNAFGASKAEAWQKLRSDFQKLPMEARRLTGPLFWLHGDESRERLELYLEKTVEGGNGCFTAESRPHVDWLGEGWYRDLAICLQAAKRLNLKMWIFDEKWWPSGEVGGKVPPEYGSKTMVAEAESVEGPRRYTQEGFGGEHFIAAVAGRISGGKIDGASLVDLSPSIKDGTLSWAVPEGQWSIMKFTWKYSGGRRILVDGASRNCVDWYIKTVYQPHYNHFRDDFGKTIVGYFYDEPETHGDWGTEVMKMLAERKVDWKRALVAWKFELAGEEQVAAKYQYQDAYAEAWGRTLYGGLSDWCREHKVVSMGHFLEHNREYLDPHRCAGNMFQLQKYSDMGGIDLVVRQMYPGQRPKYIYQTPKLGSSITHAYNKADDLTMCEMFGAYGQDITYPQMKWLTDQMQVRGVNFMIPHSINPRSPFDTDCPPYFYNGGFEPRWPLYRVYADYTSRLSLLLSGGRHVCPVAFLYLGNSYHVGKSITPEDMTTALQDALFDCDWLPYDVFEKDATLEGKEIALYQERYGVLVVPPVEAIPYGTLARAKEFFDRGGVVVGYGFLPSESATLGRTSDEIAALCDALWGKAKPGLGRCKSNPAGGRSYLLPEVPKPKDIQRVLTGDADIHPSLEVIEGETGNWLHVLHRAKDSRDVFLICNQNHEGEARQFRFRIAAAGVPECWDAMRNEITTVPHKRNGETVEVDLTLEPMESVLLVFQPKANELPSRLASDSRPVMPPIDVKRGAALKKPVPSMPALDEAAPSLAGCSWVWFPEGDPVASAPPGVRYFRKQVVIPGDRKIKAATFLINADNEFSLFVNGTPMEADQGSSRNWTAPTDVDVAKHLKQGRNQMAITATNGTDSPNPAGLIGRLTVEFDRGEPLVVAIDETWKTSNRELPGWKEANFDDGDWKAAKKIAPYGGGPWGRPDNRGRVTGSPVEDNPYVGYCTVPANLNLADARVMLEAGEIKPEAAARVTINGQDAGGFIGKPFRVEVSEWIKQGRNEIQIEPFAPESVRLSFYAK